MANTYLNRTPSSAGNRRKFTLSTWLKGHDADNLGSGYFFGAVNGSNTDTIGITASGIQVSVNSANSGALNTTRLFRDLSAWYHIVWAVDTTQGTASNRMKLYVNGEQITAFDTETYPSQDYDFGINNTVEHRVGALTGSSSNTFAGVMAHFHFIDGTQYAASDFGQTDSTTGIWKAKTSPSVTYGTNGFFLKFENSGAMGTDSAGSNNLSVASGTLTQTLDTPTNVFATFNPLHYGDTAPATTYGGFENANTRYVSTQGGSPYPYTCSTLAASTGKYYAEFKLTRIVSSSMIGITDGDKYTYLGNSGNKDACLFHDGNLYPSNSSFGNSFSDNDICGVAMDLDNMKVYFSKNGTWQNSGDPTSGSTGTGAATIPTGGLGQFHFAFGDSSSNDPACSANFGNGYFGTTAVSSAQNPDDGIGIFEYDVPAGYRALCTKSLNAEEYS